MRHEFTIKLPRLLDRKLNETPEEEAYRLENRKKKIDKAVRVGGPIVLGATVGYLLGYNRGATKLSRHKGDLYIIK